MFSPAMTQHWLLVISLTLGKEGCCGYESAREKRKSERGRAGGNKGQLGSYGKEERERV